MVRGLPALPDRLQHANNKRRATSVLVLFMARIQQAIFQLVMPTAKIQFSVDILNSTISRLVDRRIFRKLCLHSIVKVTVRLRTSRQVGLRWIFSKP